MSDADAQTIVLVRHAEKATEPKDDPALSEAGQARAKALAAALKDSKITAVFTTQARRTRDTAAVAAAQAGVTPQVLAVARGGLAAHIDETAKRAKEAGGTVLVVGHSNTVPAIVAALGGPKLADMPECEYSRLITVLPGPPVQVIQSRYGATDSDCP